MIDVLVYRCVFGEKSPELLEAFVKNLPRLTKVVEVPKEHDSDYYKVLGVIIGYHTKHKKLPPTKKSIIEFAASNRESGITEAWLTTMESSLNELEEGLDEARLGEFETPDVLIDQVVDRAEIEHIKFVAVRMSDISDAGPSAIENGKKKNPSGPADARIFAFKELSRTIEATSELPRGLLSEGAKHVAKGLDDRLKAQSVDGRIKTGFSHVDNSIIIGPQALRFIGVAGMSGDGKTTILNTLVYNFIRAGHRGLYVSFEHTPKEIWDFMTFLHTSHPDYGGYVPPSLLEWDLATDPEANIQITPEDIKHMGWVLKDIEDSTNLKGVLDVQDASTISTWEQFITHLEVHKDEYDYDFAVIDYVARLDVGGDSRFRDKEVGNIIHKAQLLTRTFNNGKGLVFITPMQVNREANKDARKTADNEKEEKGKDVIKSSYYDINAIGNFSEYQHDMDYIFSVFSSEDMKADQQMAMETLKVRKGKRPPTKMMDIDRKSGLVTVFTGKKAGEGKAEKSDFIPQSIDDDEIPDEIKTPTDDNVDKRLAKSQTKQKV